MDLAWPVEDLSIDAKQSFKYSDRTIYAINKPTKKSKLIMLWIMQLDGEKRMKLKGRNKVMNIYAVKV